jgi:hypothetical protein
VYVHANPSEDPIWHFRIDSKETFPPSQLPSSSKSSNIPRQSRTSFDMRREMFSIGSTETPDRCG